MRYIASDWTYTIITTTSKNWDIGIKPGKTYAKCWTVIVKILGLQMWFFFISLFFKSSESWFFYFKWKHLKMVSYYCWLALIGVLGKSSLPFHSQGIGPTPGPPHPTLISHSSPESVLNSDADTGFIHHHFYHSETFTGSLLFLSHQN